MLIQGFCLLTVPQNLVSRIRGFLNFLQDFNITPTIYLIPKGRCEEFSHQRPYNYGLVSKSIPLHLLRDLGRLYKVSPGKSDFYEFMDAPPSLDLFHITLIVRS